MLRFIWIRALIPAAAALAALLVFLSPGVCAERGSERPLLLGVHPYLTPSKLVKRFTPLAQYLSKKTGREVKLSISRDYEEHIERLGEGKLDMAYMGPASYVTMVSTYGYQNLLAVHEVKEKKAFRGVIIKRSGDAISSLGELRGKKFAFGDPKSTMSHLVPRYMLFEAGVDVKDLAGFEYLGSHDNVALGVLIGDFEAGAVKEETYYKYRDKGLEALEFSPLIAEHLFVANAYMPKQLVRILREAFIGLSLSNSAEEILESLKPGTTGFSVVDDNDYQSLRRIMEGLKKAGVTQ